MPRYFFHLKDGIGVLRDDAGEEFASTQEARSHAVRVARELGRNRPEHVGIGQRLLVTDDAGITLSRIPLLLEPD